MALEIDLLKGFLQRIEQKRMLQALTWNPRSTDLVEANRFIERFLEQVYNQSSCTRLGYCPPVEFESLLPLSVNPQLLEKGEGPRNSFSQA